MNAQQLTAAGWVETIPGHWHKAGELKVIGDAQQKHAKAPTSHPVVRKVSEQPKRIRQSTKPLLNKLESEFMSYYETWTGHKLVPQSVRFMLGNGIWYKPDFVLWCPTMGMKCIEVKGPHSFRGGFENLKVAAHQYPQVSWILFWKHNGKWEHQSIYS